MNSSTYTENVLKTESLNTKEITQRFELEQNIRLTHAAMGMSTEANECLDILKKHLYYGKKLDKGHLLEEIGDTLWYAAIALDALGLSFENVFEANIDKLSKRYPDGVFTKGDAVGRKDEFHKT